MDFKLVGVHQVDTIWPRIANKVKSAIDRGNASDISVSGVYQGVRSGALFLFVPEDLAAAIIVSFSNDHKSEFMRIVSFTSGKSSDWNKGISQLSEFAKANGVNRIVFDGRKGWDRKLDKVKLISYSYEMEISK